MRWWDKLIEAVKKWLKKQKPDPKPDPEPDPDPEVWENEHSEGYRVRLKTYEPPYKERRFSAKIDTRFFSELGMTSGNTRLTVDGVDLEFYGWDKENGKHDMCFTDKKRCHKDLSRPVYLRIYKDEALHTVVKIPEWRYGAIYVPKFVAWDDNTPPQPAPHKPEPAPTPTTGNKPPIVWGTDESKWSKDQTRNYGGRLLNRNKDKWAGVIMCPSKEEATNMRYRMRSHFEHDEEIEGGLKGKVRCGYGASGRLSIKVYDEPAGKLEWWIQP